MRRSLTIVVAGVTATLAGLACTRMIVTTGSGASDDPVESGAEADVGSLCQGRGPTTLEFKATAGKGRAWVTCRSEAAVIDAGVDAAPIDAPLPADATQVPTTVSLSGQISGDATAALPSRPIPNGCSARYGGQRRRPSGCPDCSPRLVTTVELTCSASTVHLSADGEHLEATCTGVDCSSCVRGVESFVGAGVENLECR